MHRSLRERLIGSILITLLALMPTALVALGETREPKLAGLCTSKP